MRKVLFLLFLFSSSLMFGQNENFTKQGFLFTPHIGHQIPKGDMYDRFLNFNSLGMSAYFKGNKNFVYGLDYDWYFGNSLNEGGTFSEITAEDQQIIDSDGHFSIVRLNIKGNYATANFGYLFNLPKDERNSGILVMVGAGFMQHKIDLVSSQLKVPQINGAYEKGYDKLTYGFATKQYVGYQYLVTKNRYHFRAGVEFNQGFTQGRRTWDFNANQSGLDQRFDATIAFKLGIVVPVYTKDAADEEFFID
jgi:hypothetical protein